MPIGFFNKDFILLLVLILSGLGQAKAFRSRVQHWNLQELNTLKVEASAYPQNWPENSTKAENQSSAQYSIFPSWQKHQSC